MIVFEIIWHDLAGNRHTESIKSNSYKGAAAKAWYTIPNINTNEIVVRGPCQFRGFFVWQSEIYLKYITSNSELISNIRENSNISLVKPSGKPTRYHLMAKMASGDEYLFRLTKKETDANVGRLTNFSMEPYDHSVILPRPESVEEDDRNISDYPLVEWAIQNKIPWSISVVVDTAYICFKHKEDAMEALLSG